jgi:hypothetical protein
MEKTSKVSKCEFKNEWTGPNGTVFYHNIELENGDSGNIGGKEKNSIKFSVGKEITYTTEEDQKGNKKIKIASKPFVPGAGQKAPTPPVVNTSTMCLSYSKDIYVAVYNKSIPGKEPKRELLFELADDMCKWIESKK